MKFRKCLLSVFVSILLFAVANASKREEFISERPPWAGVWLNTFGNPDRDLAPYSHYLAGEAGRLRWDRLQLGPNNFDFSQIDSVLERVYEADLYYYCELWTGHRHTPGWVFDAGVPEVIDGDGELYPYYMDPLYQQLLSEFFDELAAHIASLPQEWIDRIAFLQPGFGSTGDRQVYKGIPVDSQFLIDSDDYVSYMQNATLAWYAAFYAHPELDGVRFLWNIDDFDGQNPEQLDNVSDRLRGEMLYAAWMRENFNTQLRKQQFTLAIGYMDVNERNQDDQQRDRFYGNVSPPQFGGNPEFVRGEHNEGGNAMWASTPMAQAALKWHYYWTAVSSVDRGLDSWESNSQSNFFSGDFVEAFKFSHRHAFYKRPETSPYAFVALRDVLDYSDGQRFPPAQFGGGTVSRGNTARIEAIVDAYSAYGADNEDTFAVQNFVRNAYLQNSNGLNDVVWNVIDRNYQRHMVQLDPNGTSVGWWRVGSKDQPYGRFARAFENSSGKDAMYFQLVEGFIKSPPASLEVTVIYFDEFEGSTWELHYDNGGVEMAVAMSVTAEGTGEWKSETVTLTDAALARNGPMGADLALVNTDDNDDKFHLVEVRREHAKTLFGGPYFDEAAPWIWSEVLNQWLYMPEEGSSDSGFWFYALDVPQGPAHTLFGDWFDGEYAPWIWSAAANVWLYRHNSSSTDSGTWFYQPR